MSSSDSESSISSTSSKKLKTSTEEEEIVNLPATSQLWSWKVIVPSTPSSPISIPSTSMEVTSTVEKPPKMNFLERYLKETEHEQQVKIEPTDVDSPPLPPTISMDWAAFVSSRNKKQETKISVMKFPNLMMRLAAILAMLARPDVVMDRYLVCST